MPGLVGFGGFIRAHFHAPSVGANRGHLFFLTPVAVFELDAGCVAAGIATPVLFGEAALHLPGAHNDEIAAPDGYVLLFCALIEFVIGNAFAVLHPFHAAKARDVEQDATADHLVLGVLDAEHRKAARVDQLGVVSVVSLVLIEDVSKRIPMSGALHAQGQSIVGITDLVPVLLAGNGIGAGGQHLVDRIEASTEQASLWTGTIEWNAKGKYLAGADQARRLNNVLGGNVIEGADLVFLAPASPVFEFLCGFGDRLFADLDIHEAFLLFAALKCRMSPTAIPAIL